MYAACSEPEEEAAAAVTVTADLETAKRGRARFRQSPPSLGDWPKTARRISGQHALIGGDWARKIRQTFCQSTITPNLWTGTLTAVGRIMRRMRRMTCASHSCIRSHYHFDRHVNKLCRLSVWEGSTTGNRQPSGYPIPSTVARPGRGVVSGCPRAEYTVFLCPRRILAPEDSFRWAD